VGGWTSGYWVAGGGVAEAARIPQGGPRRVLVEFVVEILTPVSDAQPPRQIFDLLLGVAGEVTGQGWHGGHRDPVRVVHGNATAATVAGTEFLWPL